MNMFVWICLLLCFIWHPMKVEGEMHSKMFPTTLSKGCACSNHNSVGVLK